MSARLRGSWRYRRIGYEERKALTKELQATRLAYDLAARNANRLEIERDECQRQMIHGAVVTGDIAARLGEALRHLEAILPFAIHNPNTDTDDAVVIFAAREFLLSAREEVER